MDEFLLGASVVLFLASLVLPVIAFVLIYSTRKRLANVEAGLEKRERELRFLYERTSTAAAAPKVAREPELKPAPVLAPEPKWTPEAELEPPTAPVAPALPPEPEPAPERASPAFQQEEPTKPPPPPPIPFEQRLATIFTRVGAGALLLGVLYFFKYAVDSEWIGPMGRVLIGAFFGLGFLVFAEIVRSRTRAAYVSAVVGIGLACLYISAYASSAFYHLIPTEAAFAANAIILILGAALAWRHQAEAILVLVLIAGFLNPVLLSTGVDRPFALFSYLLVMTSVVLLVATHHGFRIAVPLSMLGVAFLFGGWYQRFFDTHDLTGLGDYPPEQLHGAYFDLTARLVPLLAVLLFALQWIAVAFRLRQIGKLPGFVKPIAVFALVVAHAGLTALLYDRAIHLGAAMVLLGVGSVLALRALDATRHLLFPMLAAFLLLLGLTEHAHSWNQTAVVALLGVWTAIYVVAFLRDFSAEHREITTGHAVRAGIALGSFAILASAVLLPSEKAIGAAIALTGTAAALSVVAHRARLPWMNLLTLLGTFLPMSIAMLIAQENSAHWAPIAVGIALLWAIAVGTAPMLAALREPEPRIVHLFSLALAELCFLGLALMTTHDDVPTLRALLTGATGAASLGLAGYLASTRSRLAAWRTLLAALALGLFAPAIAFALSGATITVLWAILTAVAALILAETREKAWLITVVLLAVATLTRIVAVDVPEASELIRSFEWSQGRTGVLALPAFFNFRAYAFFGTGFGFLGGAFLLGRSLKARPDKTLAPVAGMLAIVAYTLLTIVLIVEVRAWLLQLPPVPPVAFDTEEFNVFMDSVREARAAQHNLLAMASTVVLAGVASLLLAIGFIAKDAFHRYLGLTVFLATIGKLVGWDVWNLARIYQVVALTVVGALLLGSGFLYARLKGLFKATAVSLLLLGVALPARAETDAPLTNPVATHEYAHRRTIDGVDGVGDYVVRLDADLFRHSTARALFDDVRIADPDGREVPFITRMTPPERPSAFEPGSMFDPGVIAGGGFRATFEIPSSLEHCEIHLQLSGSAPYLRRTRVETGDKTSDMQLVAEGGLVWALFEESRAELHYPRSIARYVRVTLLPDPNASLTTITGAELGCDTPSSTIPSTEVDLQVTKIDHKDKTTVVDLDAGMEGVPFQVVTLDVGTSAFARRTTLAASSHQSVWPVVSHGLIQRYGDNYADLSLSAGGTRKRYFQITIDDGDDAPLDIRGAKGRLLTRELVFRATKPGRHLLYVGNPEGTGAQYDLADLLARADVAPRRASFGVLEPNPTHGRPEVADDLPATEKYRSTIGIVLAVVLLGLAVWAVKLIRAR